MMRFQESYRPAPSPSRTLRLCCALARVLAEVVVSSSGVTGTRTHAVEHTSVLCSFDGMLVTADADDYKGLPAHVDVYEDEPGQLQALVVLFPPPKGFRRVGVACSFYPPGSSFLWRQQALAMVSRWSTSPDMDLRRSPLPALGSKPREGGHTVLGGPFLPKAETESLTDSQLKAHIGKVPKYLRDFLPSQPKADPGTTELARLSQYLLEHGVLPLSGKKLEQAVASRSGDADVRPLFFRAVAGGMEPTTRASRDLFSTSVLRAGRGVIGRAINYGAPEKLALWSKAGGRCKRKRGNVPQPSGRVTKRQKKTGNVKALKVSGRAA